MDRFEISWTPKPNIIIWTKLFHICNVLMLNIWLRSRRILKFELCVAVKPRNCIVELLISMPLHMRFLVGWCAFQHTDLHTYIGIHLDGSVFHWHGMGWHGMALLGVPIFCRFEWQNIVFGTDFVWHQRTVPKYCVKYASLRVRMLYPFQWIMCVDKINGFCFWLNHWMTEKKRERESTFQWETAYTRSHIIFDSYINEYVYVSCI